MTSDVALSSVSSGRENHPRILHWTGYLLRSEVQLVCPCRADDEREQVRASERVRVRETERKRECGCPFVSSNHPFAKLQPACGKAITGGTLNLYLLRSCSKLDPTCFDSISFGPDAAIRFYFGLSVICDLIGSQINARWHSYACVS